MLRFLFFIFFVFRQVSTPFAQGDPPVYIYVQPESPLSIDKLLRKADSLFGVGEYGLSLRAYENTRQESRRVNNKTGIIEACIGISKNYRQTGDFEKANDILEQTLKYCSEKDSTAKYIAYIHNFLAVNYGYRGMYEESIQSYEKAVFASGTHPHPEIPVEHIYNNIAALYCNINMPHKALAYLSRVEATLSARPDIRLDIRALLTKAYAYRQLGDTEKSKHYLLTLIPAADSIKDYSTLFVAYWSLADLALSNNNKGEAQHYLDRMYEVENLVDLEPTLRIRKNRIAARLYMHQKRYDKALQQYEELLKTAKQINSLTSIITAHEGMAKAYAGQGRYPLAYDQEQMAKLYKDSLNKEEQVKNVTNIEARYRNAQKDKELAEKELLINKQRSTIKIRNITVGITVFTVLLLSTLFLIVRRAYKHKQTLKDEKMQLLVKEKELNEMKALMDGEEQERNRIARDIHDGLMIQFSTVKMNLSAALGKDENSNACLLQLDQAIASLRSTAHNLMPDVLLEGGLAEAIYYFCENIKERVPFHITFNPLNDIPRFEEKFELSVYRMVQELIQNIVKHAKANDAYIQIGYREGLLNITIEDDGVGIDPATNANSDGLGIKSIRNRMAALKGTIEISSEKDAGTSIILEFLGKMPYSDTAT